jgi:hypothetical protein
MIVLEHFYTSFSGEETADDADRPGGAVPVHRLQRGTGVGQLLRGIQRLTGRVPAAPPAVQRECAAARSRRTLRACAAYGAL